MVLCMFLCFLHVRMVVSCGILVPLYFFLNLDDHYIFVYLLLYFFNAYKTV